jgi:predicted transcriptional regulator
VYIREKNPEYISELAHLLEHSQSNVSNDVKYLEGIELLEIEVDLQVVNYLTNYL